MEKEYIRRIGPGTDERMSFVDPRMLAEVFYIALPYVEQQHGVIIDLVPFLTDFMNSETRAIMELGTGCLSYNTGHFDIDNFILVNLKEDLSKYVVEETQWKNLFVFKWIGEIYSRIRAKTFYTSKYIVHKLPIEHMRRYYLAGHEMGHDEASNWLIDVIESRVEGL